MPGPDSLLLMCVVQFSIRLDQVYREVEVQQILEGNRHLTIECCENATHYLASFTSLADADKAIRRCKAWMTARGVTHDVLERRSIDMRDVSHHMH